MKHKVCPMPFHPLSLTVFVTIKQKLPRYTYTVYSAINNGFPNTYEDSRSLLLSVIIKQSFLILEFILYMFRIYVYVLIKT
jgi:hypothetical protein